MKILFLSNAPICTPFVVGSHQLAKQYHILGHDVAHVSSPVSLLHALKSKVGRYKLKTSFTRPFSETFKVFDDIPLVPFPYAYSDTIDRINDFIVARYLNKIGFDQPDIILMDQPAFVGVFDQISAKIKIYRPTDIYDHMHRGRHTLFQSRALELCDGVITSSQGILSALKTNRPSAVITNGVDVELFDLPSPETFSGAVYIGALDERFDFEAVRALAEHEPDLSIDLYGPAGTELPNLPSNCTYRNQIKYSEIPSVLQRYKFALLPLNTNPANLGRSPMKLFEYLAAGTPVLSSKLADFDQREIRGLFTYSSVEGVIKTYQEMSEDLAGLDAQSLKDEAEKHSWQSKANQLLDWCSHLGKLRL